MSLRELYRSLSSLSPEQRALFARRLEQSGWGRQAIEIVPRPPGAGPVPASLMQQRLWLLDQMEPGHASYNLPLLCFDMQGPLDFTALERCFAEIERRHEDLRTTFAEEDGAPVQVVGPFSPRALPVIDLSALPEPLRKPTAKALSREEARRTFDLARGPLWRCHLLRYAADHHLLLICMHHIVSDAWSLGVLYREIMPLYTAFRRRQPSPLPELAIQYADFALWQRQRLQGDLLAEELRFWKELLAGAPDLIELPLDRPRPPVRGFLGKRLEVDVPPGLPEALAGVSQESRASLYTVLLAAFAALFHRYSGQTDVVIGAPVAGRNNPGTEALIGFFVNTVLFRNDLGGDPSFEELIGRVRNGILDVFEHQELPFDRLVEELQPRRDPRYGPLYQVMFSLQNTPIPDLELDGLAVDNSGLNNGTSQTDLILFAGMNGGVLGSLELEYNTEIFDAATVRRLARHLLSLLAAGVTRPELRLSELPLLATAERRQVVAEWSRPEAEEPPRPEATLADLLIAQAGRTPDAVAVEFEGREQTYQELHARAGALSRHLAGLGVGPEVRVAVCAERSLELVAGLLAVLYAGGAYVPLDPSYPAERLDFMLEDSRAAVLLAPSGLLAERPGLAARARRVVPLEEGAPFPTLPRADARERAPSARSYGTAGHLQTDVPKSDADAPGGGALSREAGEGWGGGPQSLLPDHPAYVIYTSGSTGKPKGAVNTHRAIVNRLLWMQEAYGLTADDRVLQKTPFSFDVSVWEFFWPLLTGARLVVAKPEGHRDGAYLARRIREAGVTTLHFVPSMLREILEEPDLASCTSLRRVICSGEALPAELADRFRERLPHVELHNLYGPTEAAVDVTAWDASHGSPGAVVPIGRPITHVRTYILDAAFRPVPPGAPGELLLGGVALARGYLDRPALTAAAFVPHPFAGEDGVPPGARLYRTGDLARWLPVGDNGVLEFLGRLDHQVKVRGVRIELGEVEEALLGHPGVRDGAVALRELAPGEPVLVAYYVPGSISDGSGVPEAAEIRTYLQERLPDPMLPAAYCSLDTLPRTPSGKLDRKALPAPERARVREERHLAPRTPVEQMLAGIWRELLGLERVGVDQDFFALGGHSLLAIRLVSRLRHRLQRELSAQLVFQSPTIAGIARALDAPTSEEAPIAAPAPPAITAVRRGVRQVPRGKSGEGMSIR